jgi:hypothetical protein
MMEKIMIDMGPDEACCLMGDLLSIQKGEYNEILSEPLISSIRNKIIEKIKLLLKSNVKQEIPDGDPYANINVELRTSDLFLMSGVFRSFIDNLEIPEDYRERVGEQVRDLHDRINAYITLWRNNGQK